MAGLEWSWIELAQLGLAVVLGFAVGLEREVHDKPAGITTITLVTLCATLAMQLGSKLSGPGGADPARLAAAVMTGIGFLGAGSIIRRGDHVAGITTAATIWIMTAVGLTVGAGYYIPALVTTLLVLLGFWLNPLTSGIADLARRLRRRD